MRLPHLGTSLSGSAVYSAAAGSIMIASAACALDIVQENLWESYYERMRASAKAVPSNVSASSDAESSTWFEWLPIQKLSDREFENHRARMRKMDSMLAKLHEYEAQKVQESSTSENLEHDE